VHGSQRLTLAPRVTARQAIQRRRVRRWVWFDDNLDDNRDDNYSLSYGSYSPKSLISCLVTAPARSWQDGDQGRVTLALRSTERESKPSSAWGDTVRPIVAICQR
jgi:hypothetical protein